jgi:hypothetical protein
MECVAQLREHARDFYSLARGFDPSNVRDQLLAIAMWCERLADSVERGSPEEMRKPKPTHPLFNW